MSINEDVLREVEAALEDLDAEALEYGLALEGRIRSLISAALAKLRKAMEQDDAD